MCGSISRWWVSWTSSTRLPKGPTLVTNSNSLSIIIIVIIITFAVLSLNYVPIKPLIHNPIDPHVGVVDPSWNSYSWYLEVIYLVGWDIIIIIWVSFSEPFRRDMCFELQLEWRKTHQPEPRCPCTVEPKPDPFVESSIFIQHFTYLEVEGWIWSYWWFLDEGLVSECWMIEITLQSQQSLKGGGHELWVPQSISQVRIPIFIGNQDIIFRSYTTSNWIIPLSGWKWSVVGLYCLTLSSWSSLLNLVLFWKYIDYAVHLFSFLISGEYLNYSS